MSNVKLPNRLNLNLLGSDSSSFKSNFANLSSIGSSLTTGFNLNQVNLNSLISSLGSNSNPIQPGSTTFCSSSATPTGGSGSTRFSMFGSTTSKTHSNPKIPSGNLLINSDYSHLVALPGNEPFSEVLVVALALRTLGNFNFEG